MSALVTKIYEGIEDEQTCRRIGGKFVHLFNEWSSYYDQCEVAR